MAQPLQSIDLVAPAFKGINTEDSPIAQDPSFAEVADNAIIDRRGRLASRKGNAIITTNKTVLGTDYLHNIHEFYDTAGNEVIFSTGNNKIMTGTTTLADATPGSYTISANDWKIVNFNEKAYFFQRGYDPLVYDNANGLRTFTVANGGATNATFKTHEVIAAFGRLFIVGNATDHNTIYWSDLLNGNAFTGGSSGSIDVSKVWPNGYDKVVALAAHNGLLVVFGENNTIIYSGADSPASMALQDTIPGVGCVDRKSVQNIGTDLLFLTQTGLRSLGRAIQEKSLPITDLSRNIKQELIANTLGRVEPVSSVYSPENYFYLLCFPDLNLVYCFDVRATLENGAYRVTRWPSVDFKSFHRDRNGDIYIGTTAGLGRHENYLDSGNSYRFRYFSSGLTFGDPARIKMLKKIRPTLLGGNNSDIFLKWAYDFSTAPSSSTFRTSSDLPGFYGQSEYNIVEYSEEALTISRNSLNTTGYGSVVSVGIETDINGYALSVQQMNVLALIGKTL
tara:strand:- start:2089 stop:3609 length:1521 start_codon:yes stop_codon:yes gene_type:complete